MFAFFDWPFELTIGVFVVSALVIGIFGTMMTRTADILADVTGMGEALMGAIFLGGSTSLPGITTSVTAAAGGHAELAISNAIGGIAAQTVFLAIADIAYRKVNLEHAAASVANLLQGALLTVLLALTILAMAGPQLTFWAIHPVSVLIIVAYILGLRLVSHAETDWMWRPKRTRETLVDEPTHVDVTRSQILLLWLKFALLGIIVAFAGYIVAKTGIAISGQAGISETVVGAMFTAIATSLPELVTSVAAVRQGALTLAVGGVIGGNCFDVLFVAFSDMAYRMGSVYEALSNRQLFIIALTILLVGVLLLGLLRREKHGIANIGFESFLIIVLYVVALTYLFMH